MKTILLIALILAFFAPATSNASRTVGVTASCNSSSIYEFAPTIRVTNISNLAITVSISESLSLVSSSSKTTVAFSVPFQPFCISPDCTPVTAGNSIQPGRTVIFKGNIGSGNSYNGTLLFEAQITVEGNTGAVSASGSLYCRYFTLPNNSLSIQEPIQINDGHAF